MFFFFTYILCEIITKPFFTFISQFLIVSRYIPFPMKKIKNLIFHVLQFFLCRFLFLCITVRPVSNKKEYIYVGKSMYMISTPAHPRNVFIYFRKLILNKILLKSVHNTFAKVNISKNYYSGKHPCTWLSPQTSAVIYKKKNAEVWVYSRGIFNPFYIYFWFYILCHQDHNSDVHSSKRYYMYIANKYTDTSHNVIKKYLWLLVLVGIHPHMHIAYLRKWKILQNMFVCTRSYVFLGIGLFFLFF